MKSETTWDFSYKHSSPKLKSLYSKGKKLQWNSEDYSVDASSDDFALFTEAAFPVFKLPLFDRLSKDQRLVLRNQFSAQAVSQILHGEQGALMVASQLVRCSPDYSAKMYAASQVVDEARHVEVFAGLLEKIRILYPPNKSLQVILNRILSAERWVEMLIGMQIIVEGVVLNSFNVYGESSASESVRQILQNVRQDEARHCAFGQLYVTEVVSKISEAERKQVIDFTRQIIIDYRAALLRTTFDTSMAMEEVGIDPEEMVLELSKRKDLFREVEARNGQSAISDYVVPALRRTGLMSDEILREVSLPTDDAEYSRLVDEVLASL